MYPNICWEKPPTIIAKKISRKITEKLKESNENRNTRIKMKKLQTREKITNQKNSTM